MYIQNVLGSESFWFAVVVLLLYQGSKFFELGIKGDNYYYRYPVSVNLRASDFARSQYFYGCLVLFLLSSFFVFFILCSISPSIIKGWMIVNNPTVDLANLTFAELSYPLYILGAYIGIVNVPIPGLSKFVDAQRMIFHSLIGIPRRIVERSNFFTNQILTKCNDRAELSAIVKILRSDQFIADVDSFADTVFYRDNIRIPKYFNDDDSERVQKSSDGFTRTDLAELVFLITVAAFRQSGSQGLLKLSQKLGIDVPNDDPSRLPVRVKATILGIMISGCVVLILISLLPFIKDTIEQFWSVEWEFWPSGLNASTIYASTQMLPVLLWGFVTMFYFDGKKQHGVPTGRSVRPKRRILQQRSPYLLLVFSSVIVFLYAQTLYDYGHGEENIELDVLPFLGSWLLYYMIQSFVAVIICAWLILFFSTENSNGEFVDVHDVFLTVAGVFIFSCIYALSRLKYDWQYQFTDHLDYVVVIVLLNLISFFIVLACANFQKNSTNDH